MTQIPVPSNEAQRLASLRDYGILDTPAEPRYDDLVKIAAAICGAPIAMVSLVDAERQWFKARVGIGFDSTSRDDAFCGHAILGPELFEIPDATLDARFTDNPLVTGSLGVRMYAGVPLVDDQRCALGTLCVMDTAPRRLTEAQREALTALAKQVMELMEAQRNVRRLRELSRQKAEFLRVASHDLKNPIQAILGAAEVLEAMAADAEPDLDGLREFARLVAVHATDMADIIADFVDGQAIEDGQLRLSRGVFDAAQLIRHVAEGQGPVAAEKGGRIALALPAGPLPVFADRPRLSQVLKNFVGNAIKFGPPGGTVTLQAFLVERMVRCEVRDQGPGVTPEDRQVLFTLYGRASARTTAREPSTGVGLAICKQLIEAHGGEVGVDDAPGGGALFWCTVPWGGAARDAGS
jgi:signal transduction histidine kinase